MRVARVVVVIVLIVPVPSVVRVFAVLCGRVLGRDPRVLRGHSLELVLPNPMCGHRVRLVAHGHKRAAVCPSPLERRSDDALDTFPSVHVLGDVFVAIDATAPEIDALGVLANDDEVDGVVGAKGGQIRMQQSNRSEIDVQIESKPQAQQDVPRVLVARHSRIAQRAHEDRVHVVPHVVEGDLGKRFLGPEVMIGRVRESFPRQGKPVLLSGGVKHGNRRLDHLRPDSVAANDRDPVLRARHGPPLSASARLRPPHSNPVGRPQLTQ